MESVSDAGVARKASAANLPLLRFDDLRARRLVSTWTTLNRWIAEEGFPPGRLVGRIRLWTEPEIMDWFMARPSAKAELRGRAKELAGR
jgi:hypothetical protein